MKNDLFTFANRGQNNVRVVRVMTFPLWCKYNENRNREAYNPSNNETFEAFCARRYEKYVSIKTGRTTP